MSQLPMKVSEAVERLQQEITLSGPHAEIVVVKIEDLSRLLTSHEALRLAGARLLDAPRPMVSNRVFVDAYDALSLAVEEAGR